MHNRILYRSIWPNSEPNTEILLGSRVGKSETQLGICTSLGYKINKNTHK